MPENSKLFPQPFMPPGSKGPAVVFLQKLLLAGGYNSNIIADGDYGEQTAIGVKAFQREAEIEQDGCFGPDTRRSWAVKTGLDLNTIPLSPWDGVTTVPAQ